jgi:1,4-dihydroxy-2-naphthoyl-CoA hydrolase
VAPVFLQNLGGITVTENVSKFKQRLTRIYDQNPYVRLLDITIVAMEGGRAELHMPVIQEKHTNLFGVAHGGALASLADTAMGVACATTGNRVVTIDMNINYIRSAESQRIITAIGVVIHQGRNTMVAEASMVDEAGVLFAKARGTFYIMGKFEVEAD